MYLIVKCEELGDQFECDANRISICLTEDYEEYCKRGYEIYEVLSDNTFELIKDYDTCGEEGMVLVCYSGEDENGDWKNTTICDRFPNKTRDDYTIAECEKLKKKYGFTASAKQIRREIHDCGEYIETVYNKILDREEFWVFGEYFDNILPKGY